MTYRITAVVDDFWYDILGEITKNAEGFVWVDVDIEEDDDDVVLCKKCQHELHHAR